MRRGFKSRAEEWAKQARVAVGLDEYACLDPWLHARQIGVEVLDLSRLGLPPAHMRQLVETDPDSWSGMTIQEGGITGIILNPSHPRTRQCSTLMHELAHVQLQHIPARVDVSATGLLLLSEYDEAQEDEADWLAGALLLPRAALIRYRSRGDTPADIAAKFSVSMDMCVWRLRMTGVEAQIARRGRNGAI